MEKDVGLLSEFYARMRAQLGAEEYEAFVESSRRPPWQGIRANRLKIPPEALRERIPFPLEAVRWCGEGFTFSPRRANAAMSPGPAGQTAPCSATRPAKLLEYHAGLFYIQEPSAMLPAVLLDARPGERVLDLCAAPGGKSVQLANGLNGCGLLAANDVSASRGRALVKNLELAGVTNAAVFNEQPARLAERFPAFFDKILVDAPCSGEGMFRRDPDAAKSWAANKPQACAAMQREILRYAAAMLAPGGRMVYSTCTFSEIENEGMIAEFLRGNNNFELMETRRLWPHKDDGEGHFAALLRKKGACDVPRKGPGQPPPEEFKQFCRAYLSANGENLTAPAAGSFAMNGISLYLVPGGMPDARGLRLARSGWYMGDISKGRFTPSQALAMGLRAQDARVAASLTPDEAARYVKGETIDSPIALDGKPWVLVGYGGFPLGWARYVNGRLKNHLPPGWVSY